LKLLAHLNPEQRRAVTTTTGPVLVLAGAGTGKTRVITVRIAHLLAKGVPPQSIAAMTFTNKAAREMRERVAALVGKRKARALFVGTFHAFCIELLRAHGRTVGLERFTISDGSDQLSILRSALREVRVNGATIQPALALSRISLMKNRMTDMSAFVYEAEDDVDVLVGQAWERYEAQLRRSRALDFDDILLSALKILKKRGGPRTELRQRYRYVMVDEYQDTNGPQYEIVRELAGGHRNLCVVGDDDQSIYGWRGADIGKILGFERDFPGATVVKLETNYRSTAPILRAANCVIRHNPSRHEKTLRAHRGDGPPIRYVTADDEAGEAELVVREIQSLVGGDGGSAGAKLGEFAILFRTGPQARVFEAELRSQRTPYVLVGGMSFFDRKEVRDVVAYLKLLVNPDDEVSLLRVINCPPRGIGKASIDRILEFSAANGLSVWAAFSRAAEVDGVGGATAEAVDAFLGTLKGLRPDTGRLVDRVRRLLDAVAYKLEIERCYADAAMQEQRWAAVEEILNFAENHERRHRSPSLATFLQELALEANDDPTPADEQRRDAVTLMTLHSAKGLEFPHVYLVGLEEGLLPHTRAVAEDTVEEERRLAYVGITRARRHLTLSWTKTRARRGHRMKTMPSRFLFELREKKPPKGWIAEGEERPQPPSKRRKKWKGGRRRSASLSFSR
jgi:DNA helicase-2/ATP-dependent DNA helicase PcrA